MSTFSPSGSSPGHVWTVTTHEPWYQATPTEEHPLYKPIMAMKDELADDLLEIRMKIKYSTIMQDSEGIQLKDKIYKRLCEELYDSDPKDIKELVSLIEFKEWPLDFGHPDSATPIVNGKGEGPTYIIILRPRIPVEDVVNIEKRRIKRFRDQESRTNIKNLSRLHSMKARRK